MDTRDPDWNSHGGRTPTSERSSVRPKQVTVWYRGIPYTLDLERCRRALVWRQVEGELDSMESLAAAIGISRSTASRFFSGRATSLGVTLRILGALRLGFEEVATPASEVGTPGR
ncbi:MAG TPA: helix-turn-helix transcriptional regulator [Candidatus Dormibacteraeota bacterium]|nr:helix-turn-helix transcriptional regulator [Candidatus Dormibacteraeota bacterium]